MTTPTRRPLWRMALALALASALMAWAWHARPATLAVRWHGLLIPGAALSLLSLFLYALRFRRVLHMFDLHLSPRDGLRIVSFAVFCQFFMPLGAGAELGKFLKLRGLAPQRRAMVSIAAIALEHVLGLLAVVTLAGASFAILKPFQLHLDGHWLLVAGVAIVVLSALTVLLLAARRGLDLAQLQALLSTHKSDAVLIIGWSMLMHVVLSAAVYVGSLGWGIAIHYPQILFVLTSAALFQAVPANLVGLGVADIAGTGLYVALGLPPGDALLLVSLLYCYRLLAAMLGGAWEFRRVR
ncbi:MAG: flippase-like domain-containing protein [Gammaproteobacteria bacterium]|nr:flippase-like domain-containing protein [Gammaproteobacteria bacterium]